MASLLKDNTNTINNLLTTINNLPNALTIDATLTRAGQAADAKAVGDALNEKQPIGDYVLNSELTAILPIPTAADAGKILRVNANGKYELVSLPNAEEATF